jgi:hypothetical protein
MGSMIAESLTRKGVAVYDDDIRPDEYRRGSMADHGHEHPPLSPTNVLSLMSVPTHLDGYYQGQYKSILTMWESRQMPAGFRDTIHEFDLVMVPSRQNVELFSRYHDNVEFISLGVDPTLWHPIPVTMPTTHFNFMIAGRGNRKGIDLAYEAFRKVFVDPSKFSPVPRLILKSLQGHQDYHHWAAQHISGVLEPEAERDLYASAHCYIQPSRGEGFGLQPLQAMSLGRPTILTDAHGHASFAHLGIGIDAGISKADYFMYGDAGEWWEPDFEQLCEAMWDVYSNYTTHVAKAEQSAAWIGENLTWDQTADRFIALHGDELAKPYSGDMTWIAPEKKLYRISVIRQWNGEIAGRMVSYQPGVEYWEDADVKRILFDGGVLSNECLEGDDGGLLPQQVAELPGYRDVHQYCPTCHRDFATGEKRSDVIFRELEAR